MTQALRIPESTSWEERIGLARNLLREDEHDIPVGVQETIRFLVANSVWFQLSRNAKVLSCRDAAQRRYRLGRRGIPLADELRSYLAEAADESGAKLYVLLHCRGDASIDFEAVSQVRQLGGLTLSRASLAEFDEESIGYGLVNPFVAPELLRGRGRIIQVFDPAVLDGTGETATMMTNAGEKTWAVEFDPRDLLREPVLPSALVAPIVAARDRSHDEDSSTIGILTGNAPESGALLWQKVNRVFRATRGENFRGDTSYPKVLIHSLPAMGWSMELSTRQEKLLPVIVDEVRQMEAEGAAVLALACNTTQFFEPEITSSLANPRSEFVPLARSVEKWLQQNVGNTIFVAGIGHVTGELGWSAYPYLRQMHHVRTPTENQSRFIEKLAYDVKQHGVDHRAYQKLRALVRSARADKCLLLLTELSMIFEAFPRTQLGQTEIVDAMDIYAETIVTRAISRRVN